MGSFDFSTIFDHHSKLSEIIWRKTAAPSPGAGGTLAKAPAPAPSRQVRRPPGVRSGRKDSYRKGALFLKPSFEKLQISKQCVLVLNLGIFKKIGP